jgi:hypothetical protein
MDSVPYQTSGKRKSRLVAIDPMLHPDPRAAWESRLGTPIASFGTGAATEADVPATNQQQARRSGTVVSPADIEALPDCLREVSEWTQPVTSPLFEVDDIRRYVGVSAFALKNARGRARYRKMSAQDRDRAAVAWMASKVGRERFIAAVRETGKEC